MNHRITKRREPEMSKAKIFTILQFYVDEADEKIINRVHYVAATCSEEAEDVFKADFGKNADIWESGQFYVLTNEAMTRSTDNGMGRCMFYVDSREAPPMTQGDYTRWILAFTRRLWNEEIACYEGPTYRRFYA